MLTKSLQKRLALPRKHKIRLRDPGTLYNLGNALCLSAGILVTWMTSAASAGGTNLARELGSFLFGSPAAVLISLSTLTFFLGGAAYSQAWAKGAPPNAALNQRGDLYSAFGAALFGAGMVFVGNPLLALSAGLMHALGKFGSAFAPETALGREGFRAYLSRAVFRDVVVISRIPALISAATGVVIAIDNASAENIILSATALVSCLLWMVADMQLLTSDSQIRRVLFPRFSL